MKKLAMIGVIALFAASMFFSDSMANRQRAGRQGDSCRTNCRAENRKCIREAQKVKGPERKTRLTECRRLLAECQKSRGSAKKEAAKEAVRDAAQEPAK